MEAAVSSEMLLLIYETASHHIPEDHNCNTHYSDNLKSDTSTEVFTSSYHGKGSMFDKCVILRYC
jgi:hypothetical protein